MRVKIGLFYSLSVLLTSGSKGIRAMHKDVSSSSNFNDFVVKHVSLNWRVNFSSQTVVGSALYTIAQLNPAANQLILDVRDVHVTEVKTDGEIVDFTLEENPVAALGQSLKISIPPLKESDVTRMLKLIISYSTDRNCSALQWLEAEQTSSKVAPFVYSQCQAIHCRSLLPIQDSPSVKFTYDAKVTVSDQLTALMSAEGTGVEQSGCHEGEKIYSFQQKVPIPSYLIAIVVGALQSRQIGPRSKVWAEADVVDAAAWEFAETEKILTTAEELLGPYVWGTYDLLILPPSFPYGGMENPCLTFVTPTLLTGDRSQVSVIAHEIAHSWTGNLFSCASWEHFWLNEGHTRFVEEKICATLVGNPLHRDFMALHSWAGLEYYVNLKGADHPFTKLVPNLTGIDPDDAFSVVPYEKGMSFLAHIEQKVGGPAVMDPFIRYLIEQFKFKSLDTDEWKAFLRDYFRDLDSIGKLSIDWDTWLNAPGLPVKPQYDSTLVVPCHKLAAKWVAAKEVEIDQQFSAADLTSFVSVAQIAEFLSQLVKVAPLPHWKIAALDRIYKLSDVKDVSRLFLWYRLALLSRWEPIIQPAIELAIVKQGRMKFTLPLFRDLHNWDLSRPMAIETFLRHRRFMHQTTAGLIQKEFNIVETTADPIEKELNVAQAGVGPIKKELNIVKTTADPTEKVPPTD